MKKIVILILSLVFCLLSLAQRAEAHFLVIDGDIGVVLHVDPNDDPVAARPAYFFFTFKDATGKFQAKNCYCRINIVEQDKVIYSQTAFQDNTDPSTQTTSL